MATLTTVVYSTGALLNTTAGTASTIDNMLGSAGTPSSNVLSVQGITNGTTLSVTPVGVAQGSTSSGQTGSLIMGAVTTAAPTYTNAQTSPLSLNAAGDLRTVIDSSTPVQVLESLRANKAINLVTVATTTETVFATGATATFLDLYGLVLANGSATATTLIVKDTTAGTSRMEFYLPAGDTRGFMLTESAAIPQSATNSGWTATLGTSVSSVFVTALYVKNAG